MNKIFFLLLLFFSLIHSVETPNFIFREGRLFSSFDLIQGKIPCKENSPCLYFHKDSDNLRLIVNGKNIRMAYKSNDKEKMPYPKHFKTLTFQDKAEVVKNYRDFFRSEFAVMLQAFIYTTPELFDWNVEKFKEMQNSFLITEDELNNIFESENIPEFYTILKFKCKNGEETVFESDANGNFFMEIK